MGAPRLTRDPGAKRGLLEDTADTPILDESIEGRNVKQRWPLEAAAFSILQLLGGVCEQRAIGVAGGQTHPYFPYRDLHQRADFE